MGGTLDIDVPVACCRARALSAEQQREAHQPGDGGGQ